jgi:hypothetical protein
MTRIIDEAHIEPTVRALLGAIDVGDGGTGEQRTVLRAVVDGYWQRPDLDLASLEPLDPTATAAAIPDQTMRGRVRELMVALELCRHPLTPEQVALVDEYAAALGEDGPGLLLARDLTGTTMAQTEVDFARSRDAVFAEWSEQSLVARYVDSLPAPDAALRDRLLGFWDLPEGTLGREYVEFYRRNGFALPGESPATPAFFVAHDMTHVIAGYGPTGPEEVALSACILAMHDTHAHWVLMLTSLVAYEVGFSTRQDSGFVAKQGLLARDGAADLFAEALTRGAACTGDFASMDHLAAADRPVVDIREEYGLPARRV